MSYQQNRFRNKKAREAIFNEDGNRCAYCLVDFATLPVESRTVDHIVARTDGGTNATTNLLSACHACNSRRRHTPLHVFVGIETIVRLIRDYPRVARTIVESMR